MTTILTILFIVLAISLGIVEYLVEERRLKKLSAKEIKEYMLSNLIVGQKGSGKLI